MAIKFDFNRLRTAIKGFLVATETAGSDVVHLPKLQAAAVVEKITLGAGGAKVLTANDYGKIFLCTQSGGTDSAVTLPAAAAGGTLTFISAASPGGTGDMVISGAVADKMIVVINGDADADGPNNTAADSITFEAAGVGGERIDCVSDGDIWYVQGHQTVVGAISTTG
tara:strand:+ start:84 stop:587 length:504 start_codon:yes stop_codon:yes gene_type:complete